MVSTVPVSFGAVRPSRTERHQKSRIPLIHGNAGALARSWSNRVRPHPTGWVDACCGHGCKACFAGRIGRVHPAAVELRVVASAGGCTSCAEAVCALGDSGRPHRGDRRPSDRCGWDIRFPVSNGPCEWTSGRARDVENRETAAERGAGGMFFNRVLFGRIVGALTDGRGQQRPELHQR